MDEKDLEKAVPELEEIKIIHVVRSLINNQGATCSILFKMSSTEDIFQSSFGLQILQIEEMSSKVLEKIVHLSVDMKSVKTLEMNMLEEMQQLLNQSNLCDSVLTYQLRVENAQMIPLFLAAREKYNDFDGKLNNFKLKLEHAVQKKKTKWEEIQKAFSAKINAVGELEKKGKQLDRAIQKIHGVNKSFQHLKVEWDSINLKEQIEAVIRQTDELLVLQQMHLN
ncbi:unnamed protein product [Orchesella dallaii]|uniref:Uncharacterized protein n=1 Tax=Orchesella dallaii TaxID=48710 RepID=A0ABP1QLK0_9HEXA